MVSCPRQTNQVLEPVVKEGGEGRLPLELELVIRKVHSFGRHEGYIGCRVGETGRDGRTGGRARVLGFGPELITRAGSDVLCSYPAYSAYILRNTGGIHQRIRLLHVRTVGEIIELA